MKWDKLISFWQIIFLAVNVMNLMYNGTKVWQVSSFITGTGLAFIGLGFYGMKQKWSMTSSFISAIFWYLLMIFRGG